MPFLTDIEDTFLTELNNFLTIPVILDFQSAPEPQGDYGVFGVTTFTKLTRDSSRFYKTDTGFEESVRQEWNVLVTLSFYGDSCYENAFKVSAWLSSRATQEVLQQEGCMSILDVQGIRRIPELRDTGYVQRVTLDFNVLITQETINEVDWFDTVTYSGEYIDVDGTIVLTEQETVSAND